MIFGDLPLAEAEGALLAHAVLLGGRRFPKGRVITAELLAAARAAGMEHLAAARLEAGDVGEDAAARRIAEAIMVRGDGGRVGVKPAIGGRINFSALESGLLVVDEAAVHALNKVDPAITLATLPNFTRVKSYQTVATIKIIPFAVPQQLLEQAAAQAGTIGVRLFRRGSAILVETHLGSIADKVRRQTREATEERLAALRLTLDRRLPVPHEVAPLAAALGEAAAAGPSLILVAPASATTDPADIVPTAIRQAGGRVERVGMPVDPGNLLVLGSVAAVPVVGLPGCARSPKRNGLDLVLERLAAGIDVSSADIAAMGVGGLLEEGSRPLPREAREPVGVVVLAAGLSRRMGRPKMSIAIDGKPMLRHAIEAAKAAGLPVVAVTGAQAVDTGIAAGGVPTVHCTRYAEGLSQSVATGLSHAAVRESWRAALFLPGDLPFVRPETLRRLADALEAGAAAVVPVHDGRRGNPAGLSLTDIDLVNEAIRSLSGDRGLGPHLDRLGVEEVAVDDPGIHRDIDRPEDLL